MAFFQPFRRLLVLVPNVWLSDKMLWDEKKPWTVVKEATNGPDRKPDLYWWRGRSERDFTQEERRMETNELAKKKGGERKASCLGDMHQTESPRKGHVRWKPGLPRHQAHVLRSRQTQTHTSLNELSVCFLPAPFESCYLFDKGFLSCLQL